LNPLAERTCFSQVDTVTVVVGRHKLIQTDPEAPHGVFVAAAGWTGPDYPNRRYRCHYMIQPLVELYEGCTVVLKVL
jgi:hypothetical protein